MFLYYFVTNSTSNTSNHFYTRKLFLINTPTDHKQAVSYSVGLVFHANRAGIDPYSCGNARCDAVQAGEPVHEPECIPDILAAFWRVPDLS